MKTFSSKLNEFAVAVLSKHRSVMNVVILLLTGAAQQTIDVTAFKCPCINRSELNAGETNFWYGLAYLFAPAIVLFLVGILISADLWKWLTGCCTRECNVEHFTTGFRFCTKGLVVALLSPSAWISISLLDGDSLACALTRLPYRLVEKNQTCADMLELQPTDDYNDNKHLSQTVGWILITLLSFIATVVYTVSQCCSHRTYYQSMYHRRYREIEKEAIEEEFKENKAEKTKAAKKICKHDDSCENEKKKWNQILDLFTLNKDISAMKLETIASPATTTIAPTNATQSQQTQSFPV
ncbi:calcium homeostasis modulator protein 6-like [Clavelina lepadiformis]|uniref:calcium homeostasis modulator protein 6-like n=1 Tax=Clavelina lepadiformis TaxID=159417 RepID=UPI0040420E2D